MVVLSVAVLVILVATKGSSRGQMLPIRGQMWLKTGDDWYFYKKGKSAKTFRLGFEGRVN